MDYIQISGKYNARALWLLFTHSPTKCFPMNIYAVSKDQIRILKRKGVPFSRIDMARMEFPKPEAYR